MSGSTHSVTLHRSLRPVRLAFLIPPDDAKSLRNVIEVNTCLWGGLFNGIIPVYQRAPKWWSEPLLKTWSARRVVRGYIDAFEPDYVVAADPKLAVGLELEEGRLLTLQDVFSSTRDEPVECGLSVLELYQHLYEREFQFVRRHPRMVVLPTISDPTLSLFAAACFGVFPVETTLSSFEHEFKDAFDSRDLNVDAKNLFEVLAGEPETPLRMGSEMLEVRHRTRPSDPTLFFMDGTQPRDLIDYWNLRALGWRILPVPKQWAGTLGATCSDFVGRSHVPNRYNLAMKQYVSLLRSRSTTRMEFDAFAKQIFFPDEHALFSSQIYPRIWDEGVREADHVVRCEVFVDETDTECVVEDGRLSFRTMTPTFVEDSRWTSRTRWINVVRLRDKYPFTTQLTPETAIRRRVGEFRVESPRGEGTAAWSS